MYKILSLLKRPATRCDATARDATALDATPPPPPPPSSSDNSTSSPPPPPTSSPPSSSDSIASAALNASSISNPGPYEHASMDAKRLVALDTYDGFRLDINRPVSPFVLAAHSFWLGTSMIPGSSKTYTHVTQVSDEEGILIARVDPARGSVDARVHRSLVGGALMAKIQAQASVEGQNDQLLGELDFGAETWMGNVKYGSMAGGNMCGCNYFQSVTKNLAVGGEGMYIGANKALLSSYMMKYSWEAPGEDGNSSLVANFNTGQGLLTLNYMRTVTKDRVVLGAELQCSPMTLESQVSFGAEVKLQRSKINLCVDGTGKIQTVLEADLGIAHGSPTLTFTAELDHGKDLMRFGYGLKIGA